MILVLKMKTKNKLMVMTNGQEWSRMVKEIETPKRRIFFQLACRSGLHARSVLIGEYDLVLAGGSHVWQSAHIWNDVPCQVESDILIASVKF